MTKKILYALDFDGVICDSAVETGITGWKVANIVWTDMPEAVPDNMIDLFRQVRPVMETGYEAALIVRHLFEGVSPKSLLESFDKHLRHLIRRDEIDIERLKFRFGETRDNWIAENPDGWLAMNPLFDGIADKLAQLNNHNVTIITTKQERFVNKILQANVIHFPADRIYGLDRRLSKTQILTNLLHSHPEHEILFVEDRLPTLNNVINDEGLDEVKLYLADWGYNTNQDKQAAKENDKILSLNLSDFAEL
jgi:phosphoglycolate phosphatase-like HAD superfamily hydrolase